MIHRSGACGALGYFKRTRDERCVRMCVKLGNTFSMRGVSGCLVVCLWFTFARAEMDVDSASLK